MSLSPRPETLTIDDRAVGQRRRDLVERGDGVRGLERAEDALGAREQLEAGQGLVVGDRQVGRRGPVSLRNECSGPTPG